MLHATCRRSQSTARTMNTVAALVALVVLAGCGNSPETQSGSVPSATGQDTPTSQSSLRKEIAAEPADREVHEHTAFHSPTGNIGCQISPKSVRCDIDQRTWSPPPRPVDCTLDFGQGISLETGGSAQFVCAGDTARVLPPYAGAGEPLAYGQAITAGAIRCESAEMELTCRDATSGHGFSMSREAYSLF
nr:hypothetical protein CPGR_02134 [Mycolicibacterium komanii]